MMYVVELEKGLYLAPWSGDPGRTYNLDISRKYKTEKGAKIALGLTRYTYRSFKDAKIIKLDFNSQTGQIKKLGKSKERTKMKSTANCFICDGDGDLDIEICPSCHGVGKWELDFDNQDIGCSYCAKQNESIEKGFCQRGHAMGYMQCGVIIDNPPLSSAEKEE
jgi:DnaJ-class molecular chaperone